MKLLMAAVMPLAATLTLAASPAFAQEKFGNPDQAPPVLPLPETRQPAPATAGPVQFGPEEKPGSWWVIPNIQTTPPTSAQKNELGLPVGAPVTEIFTKRFNGCAPQGCRPEGFTVYGEKSERPSCEPVGAAVRLFTIKCESKGKAAKILTAEDRPFKVIVKCMNSKDLRDYPMPHGIGQMSFAYLSTGCKVHRANGTVADYF